MNDGREVTVEMFKDILEQELVSIRKQVGDQAYQNGHYDLAAQLLEQITTSDEFAEFLTLVAYEHLA